MNAPGRPIPSGSIVLALEYPFTVGLTGVDGPAPSGSIEPPAADTECPNGCTCGALNPPSEFVEVE
jgi:hypothetical protein